MGFFNTYPYTDMHELNLDWIIGKVKELDSKINDNLDEYIREHISELFVSAMYDAQTETLILILEESEG